MSGWLLARHMSACTLRGDRAGCSVGSDVQRGANLVHLDQGGANLTRLRLDGRLVPSEHLASYQMQCAAGIGDEVGGVPNVAIAGAARSSAKMLLGAPTTAEVGPVLATDSSMTEPIAQGEKRSSA